MKITVVCSLGLGSSFMIEMNVKELLQQYNIKGIEVEHVDIATANYLKSDIFICSSSIDFQHPHQESTVICLENLLDIEELELKLRQVIPKEVWK